MNLGNFTNIGNELGLTSVQVGQYLIDLGYRVKDSKGIHVNKVIVEVWKSFQYEYYCYICQKYKYEFDWIAFFDDDEYLYDSQHRTISDILSCVPATTSSVLVPWLVFGSNNKVLSSDKDVTRLEYYTVAG